MMQLSNAHIQQVVSIISIFKENFSSHSSDCLIALLYILENTDTTYSTNKTQMHGHFE